MFTDSNICQDCIFIKWWVFYAIFWWGFVCIKGFCTSICFKYTVSWGDGLKDNFLFERILMLLADKAHKLDILKFFGRHAPVMVDHACLLNKVFNCLIPDTVTDRKLLILVFLHQLILTSAGPRQVSMNHLIKSDTQGKDIWFEGVFASN